MSISVDHPTDRPNFCRVNVPGRVRGCRCPGCRAATTPCARQRVTLWFSYHTPIAFHADRLVVRENDWSATTGKHLNYIDGGRKADRIPGWRFEELLAEALA